MIYLVRHGQTNWNKEGRIQGIADIPLNASGIQQALSKRQVFKDHHFSYVYTSPLSRASKTAEILTSKSQVDHFIETDDLKEYDFGLRDGLTIAEDSDELEKNSHRENPIEYHEEDQEEFLKRLSRILVEAGTKEGNIMLVTHGAVISTYLQMLTPIDAGNEYIILKNNSVCCIDNRFNEDGNLVLTLVGANMEDEQIKEFLEENDKK